jgi:hypothetical protein
MSTYNPFEHFDELVFTNVWAAGPWGIAAQPTTMLPDGHVVPTAVAGHPETITYWLKDDAGVCQQITHAQQFVQDLWLHAAYGKALDNETNLLLTSQNLSEDFHLTVAQFVDAALSMPKVVASIVAAGYTADQVIAYAEAERPDVMLVGVPTA